MVAGLCRAQASAGEFGVPSSLRSHLAADYGPDELGHRVGSLRLSIIADVFDDLGVSGLVADAQRDGIFVALGSPVPTATAQTSQQRLSLPSTPTVDVTATENPVPSPTSTKTPNSTQGPGPTSPAICSQIYAERSELKDDRFEIKVRNDSSATGHLTYSSLVWNTAYAPPMRFEKFEFQGRQYYESESYASPVAVSAPSIALAAGDRKPWKAQFKLEGQPLEGYFGATLLFEFPGGPACTVAGAVGASSPSATSTPSPTDTPQPTPTLNCSQLTVEDTRLRGSRFEVKLSNNSAAPIYLIQSTLVWNTAYAPPMHFKNFEFRGDRYYKVDSYQSPVTASAPDIELAAGDSERWKAEFKLEGQPFEGYFSATLIFDLQAGGTCTVFGELDAAP